jgi:hypothetical protein
MRRWLVVFMVALTRSAIAQPVDPRDTTVAFTIAWAKRLQGFHTLADLQRAAGGKGSCVPYSGDNGVTWQECRWRSSLSPRVEGAGYMTATIASNGTIGVGISTVEDVTIVLNTNGSFICDRCQPPTDIER